MPKYRDEEPEYEDYDDEEQEEWTAQPLWQRLLPLVVALVVGGLVGLLVGGRVFSSSSTSQVNSDACLVLAGELYAKGELVDVVRAHLDALGYSSPASSLNKLADNYEAAGNPLQKSESVNLRRLANGLQAAAIRPSTPTTVGQSLSPPTATRPATGTPTVARGSPIPAATQTTKPALGKTGLISSGGLGVQVRKEPNRNSEPLASLNDNTRVEILETVKGEAVTFDDTTWYRVKAGDTIGYVYGRLIEPSN